MAEMGVQTGDLSLPAPFRGDHKLFIGGKWREAAEGGTIDVEDPATGEIIARSARGTSEDIDAAVKAARAALEGPWSKMPPMKRTNLLLDLADRLEKLNEEFALAESYDIGQPLAMSRPAAASVPDTIRYFAGWASKITGETMTPLREGEYHAFTSREPVGVVGLIVPWNSPYTIAITKMASALAAGCTVIIKPAEQTPLATVRLAEIIAETGFPDGVVNVVTGYGSEAGAALVEHPDVNKIAFTGSTETGRSILRAAAGTIKRVTLELGGKSPIIILPDADLERAIPAAANGIFLNSGQICLAGSRLYAHRDVYDRVVEGVVDWAKNLKVGQGREPGVQMGPVVSGKQLERVMSLLKQGKSEGASVVTGGEQMGDRGYFVEPTVLATTRGDMSVMRQEIFGPVLCANSFDDASVEALTSLANDTQFGLGATMWTQDITLAHRLAKRIKAGMVKINTPEFPETSMPFGGFKQSGLGRERGREGVEIYTELKSVVVGL